MKVAVKSLVTAKSWDGGADVWNADVGGGSIEHSRNAEGRPETRRVEVTRKQSPSHSAAIPLYTKPSRIRAVHVGFGGWFRNRKDWVELNSRQKSEGGFLLRWTRISCLLLMLLDNFIRLMQ